MHFRVPSLVFPFPRGQMQRHGAARKIALAWKERALQRQQRAAGVVQKHFRGLHGRRRCQRVFGNNGLSLVFLKLKPKSCERCRLADAKVSGVSCKALPGGEKEAVRLSAPEMVAQEEAWSPWSGMSSEWSAGRAVLQTKVCLVPVVETT